jgi:hypothetical protein
MKRNKVQAVAEAVTLQYANGKTVYRKEVGKGRFVPFVGFHIEVGKSEAVDEALKAENIPQIEIKHQRQGGAEIVRHWNLGEQVKIFPLTSGPLANTIAGCLSDRLLDETLDAGLAMRWPDGERSKFAIRGYLVPLVDRGCTELIQFSTRSRMTDRLLSALVAHAEVAERADELLDRQDDPVMLVDIALPLGTASEEEEWGKGDTATVVPFRCLHPDDVSKDYVESLLAPESLNRIAHRDWDSVVTWAHEYHEKSAGPNERGEDHDAAEPAPTRDAPAQERPAVAFYRRMLKVAEQMGLDVSAVPADWAERRDEEIAKAGGRLREALITTVKNAWMDERDAGQEPPAAEMRTDLKKAEPEALLRLYQTIRRRTPEPQDAAA